MAFELFISQRYLRAGQGKNFISLVTLLSVAGVMVGVMALIVVIAVMAGFEADLRQRILGVESHIVLSSPDGPIPAERETLLEAIRQTPGVVAATPFIRTQIMIRADRGDGGARLRGVDPDTVASVVEHFEPSDLAGLSPDRAGDRPGVILGRELAANLGVVPGDPVYLVSPLGALSPMGHIPSMKRFEVVGLFRSGMYEYDSTLAYVRLEAAQRLLHLHGRISGVEVRVRDPYRSHGVATELKAAVAKLFPETRFQATDWKERNQSLFSALRLEKTVMFIILALIVLVAAFNIASALIMTVMEKTRDIAILKAMGASPRSIRKIFVYKGMAVGLVGTGLGVGLGLVLCLALARYEFVQLPQDVFYVTTLPVVLAWADVAAIAAAAVCICLLATLYPAGVAGRLHPVRTLRDG